MLSRSASERHQHPASLSRQRSRRPSFLRKAKSSPTKDHGGYFQRSQSTEFTSTDFAEYCIEESSEANDEKNITTSTSTTRKSSSGNNSNHDNKERSNKFATVGYYLVRKIRMIKRERRKHNSSSSSSNKNINKSKFGRRYSWTKSFTSARKISSNAGGVEEEERGARSEEQHVKEEHRHGIHNDDDNEMMKPEIMSIETLLSGTAKTLSSIPINNNIKKNYNNENIDESSNEEDTEDYGYEDMDNFRIVADSGGDGGDDDGHRRVSGNSRRQSFSSGGGHPMRRQSYSGTVSSASEADDIDYGYEAMDEFPISTADAYDRDHRSPTRRRRQSFTFGSTSNCHMGRMSYRRRGGENQCNSSDASLPVVSNNKFDPVSNIEFERFVFNERCKNWLVSFLRCDPRYQILTFFNDVADEGANDVSIRNFDRIHVSPLLKMFCKASVFTVWRPTSKDAIRRMMMGEGVGKGLDIKGKSAKRGKLSSFVPFLQINKEEHKSKIRTLKKNSKIRIFFDNEKDRDHVANELRTVARELQQTVEESKRIIRIADSYDEDNDDGDQHQEEEEEERFDEETIENAMRNMSKYDMEDPSIDTINTYARTSRKYGIAVQERLFWEGMVARQSIERKIGSPDDTGRSSLPSFQDMNFHPLRSKTSADIIGGKTRAVLLQYRPPPPSTTDDNDDDSGSNKEYDPMSPLNLVMAYEENDRFNRRCRIIPCVSDFDCFIVGSRGVKYEEKVPSEQLDVLKWSMDQIEKVLSEDGTDSWTKRWLGVLKECGRKGYKPHIPSGGYSDPKTKFIFKHAIDRLSGTGCVRHGAECFNYSFPQELDDQFLIVSDDLPDEYNGRNWAYVDVDELKELLLSKIKRGYTFPLNPKWILCDPGWKVVYDQLMASKRSNVKKSMDCWYPIDSGIRERIESISAKYPNGFNTNDDDEIIADENRCASTRGRRRPSLSRMTSEHNGLSVIDGTAAMDLAEAELKYYLIFQRARLRLKGFLIVKRLLDKVREDRRRKEEEEKAEQERLKQRQRTEEAGETERKQVTAEHELQQDEAEEVRRDEQEQRLKEEEEAPEQKQRLKEEAGETEREDRERSKEREVEPEDQLLKEEEDSGEKAAEDLNSNAID